MKKLPDFKGENAFSMIFVCFSGDIQWYTEILNSKSTMQSSNAI